MKPIKACMPWYILIGSSLIRSPRTHSSVLSVRIGVKLRITLFIIFIFQSGNIFPVPIHERIILGYRLSDITFMRRMWLRTFPVTSYVKNYFCPTNLTLDICKNQSHIVRRTNIIIMHCLASIELSTSEDVANCHSNRVISINSPTNTYLLIGALISSSRSNFKDNHRVIAILKLLVLKMCVLDRPFDTKIGNKTDVARP